MKRFYPTTKDPITNIPTCYYNFVTTGLYSPNPTETNTKKLIYPIRIMGSNFPPDNPTRFFIDLPGVPDYAGAFDPSSGRNWVVKVYRPSTSNWINFTLVAQGVTLGVNQCKIFSPSSENCMVMELHNGSVTANDLVYIDGYFVNTGLHAAEANTLIKGVSTVVVASSNSYFNSRAIADYVIDTTEDAGVKIQGIINSIALNGTGGRILFMEGDYYFSTYITLNNGITIEGNNTSFYPTANMNYLIVADNKSNVRVSRIKIYGTNSSYAVETGIQILGTSGSPTYFNSVDNCVVAGCKKYGIYIGGLSASWRTIYAKVYNNVVENCNYYSDSTGIIIGYNEFAQTYDNVCINNKYGIQGSSIIRNNYLINNSLKSVRIISQKGYVICNYASNNIEDAFGGSVILYNYS